MVGDGWWCLQCRLVTICSAFYNGHIKNEFCFEVLRLLCLQKLELRCRDYDSSTRQSCTTMIVADLRVCSPKSRETK